jgi:hypothetical protein
LRSEVEVLSRDPDRGNPTLTRQGRGPELTGRSQCGLVERCGVFREGGSERGHRCVVVANESEAP